MTDRDEKLLQTEKPRASDPVLYILAAALAAIAGFGAVTLSAFVTRHGSEPLKPAAQSQNTGGDLSAGSSEDGRGGMTKLVYAEQPKPLPEVTFTDDGGAARSLADWKGKVILLNLWATWCAPCKQEMPSLNHLQSQLGGADFAVVPISLDRTGPDVPRKFLTRNNLTNLPLLLDATGGMAGKVGAIGLPASLILDREGREIARLLGPAEWDSAPAQEVIRAAIAGKPKGS